jgi:hypothetical protein
MGSLFLKAIITQNAVLAREVYDVARILLAILALKAIHLKSVQFGFNEFWFV